MGHEYVSFRLFPIDTSLEACVLCYLLCRGQYMRFATVTTRQ